MGIESWLVLGGHLKKTVKKLKLLRRRRVGSIINGSASYRRRLSISARPGLQDYVEDERFNGNCSVTEILQRASSYDSDDDVDKRADIFIANFHCQLRLERDCFEGDEENWSF